MNTMKKTIVFLIFLVALTTAVPLVVAQGVDNWPTIMRIDEPFQIGNLIFPSGNYYFQLSPGTVSRQVLMVYSLDRARWEGIVMGITAYNSENQVATGFTFVKQASGEPKQLEYWFYPNWSRGIKFISSQNPQMVLTSRHSGKAAIAMIAGQK